MSTTRRLAGVLAALLLTAACSGQTAGPSAPGSSAPASSGAGASGDRKPARVLFLGDSVAAGEALPLAAAFDAADADFTSIASDGGGNVVGPFSDKNWEKLPGRITEAEPTAVVYQITTYDWGTLEQQQAGYARLLKTVTAAGAKLIFVTMPPIKADDFYRPHLAELGRAPAVARTVAASSPEHAAVLDAGAVWGSTYRQNRDGAADRSADGIHTCPQGAARFTHWLIGELAAQVPGIRRPAAGDWANTGWSADKHFTGC
jgi:hypothetical protein